MSNTTNLNIALVAANQAQKEVTVNTAITTIDAILNRGVIDYGLNTPPGSPSDGDLYIIGSSPTGDWASNANDITYYQSGWKFIAPNEGVSLWVNDENVVYTWDGLAWITNGILVTSASANDVLQYDGGNFVNQSNLDNLSKCGVNTTSDTTNKLAVKSDAVLFDNNGSNSQVKVNKNAAGDTASYLFQTSSSGRAELGLVGDDDFQAKVSSDGSTWYQSYVITKSTGDIAFKQKSSFEDEVNCNDQLIIRAELKDYAQSHSTPSSSSGSLTLDLENGNVFEVTLTENVSTTVFSNPPSSGKAGSFKLILKQDSSGGHTFAWPASVDWASSTAPTLTSSANAVDVLTFLTTDGGTTWYGFLNGANMG